MSLTDQVVINNFVNSVDEAIKAVGGDTSSVQYLCDYPRIIREQLLASGVNVELVEGDGIKITKDGASYIISANSEAKISSGFTFGDNVIPQESTIQSVFEQLFNNILHEIPSIISGDIIITSELGTDQYQHPNYDPDIIRVKKGLKIKTLYLRIYISSQEEPIYIPLDALSFNEAPMDGKTYGRNNSKWVEIDESGKTTAVLSPTYPNDQDIPAGTPIQEVFEKIFDEILPGLPSVLKGDIILSSKIGDDTYQHPKYQEVNNKTGLDPETYYIRLFLNSQEEPLYISCEPLKIQSGGSTEGKIYEGSIGANIDINVDNITNIISATLKNIPYEMISEHVKTAVDDSLNSNKMTAADAKSIFDEVFLN